MQQIYNHFKSKHRSPCDGAGKTKLLNLSGKTKRALPLQQAFIKAHWDTLIKPRMVSIREAHLASLPGGAKPVAEIVHLNKASREAWESITPEQLAAAHEFKARHDLERMAEKTRDDVTK